MSKTFNHGYKFKIYPDKEQKKQLNRFIDLFRYVYNWGVAKEEEIYERYKLGNSDYGFYSYYSLNRLFTEERNKPGNEWLKEIPGSTARLALRNVSVAYKKFFKGITGYPKFKSKKKAKKSFNTRHDRFKIRNNCIKIEGIETYIPLNFDCGFNINQAINPAITLDDLGDFYISFSMQEEIQELDIPKSEGIGIDLGVRQTFVLSTGEIYCQPKERLDKLEHKRRRQQRHVTRDINRRLEIARHTKTKYEDIPKSKRAIKREQKLHKTYRKIHNIKDTFYHTITKQIVMRNPEYVCMETFLVRKMEKENEMMHRILCNTSFYDITLKMKEKCNTYNIPFIQAPMDFASTKTCSNCGNVQNMHGKHTYKCKVCGMEMDRDINAAINLASYGSQFL